ncbi:MAG: transposase [Gammaproteobacteria bacterium]
MPGPVRSKSNGVRSSVCWVETCFPRALCQRCLVHRLRNLQSKAPESQWPEIAIRARACYEAASAISGPWRGESTIFYLSFFNTILYLALPSSRCFMASFTFSIGYSSTVG